MSIPAILITLTWSEVSCWLGENWLEVVAVGVALFAALVAFRGNTKTRQLHQNLNRINKLEEHQSTLIKLRSRLRSRLLVIESVATQGGVKTDAEDVIPQTRRVSRSFRQALKCYGDSYQLYDGMLKRDLDNAQLEKVQTAMETAARAFSTRFQAKELRDIVDLHSKALDRLTEAVDTQIRGLKEQTRGRRNQTPKAE